MSKLIGISCSERNDHGNTFQFLNNDYIEAVIKAGGIPVLLPMIDKNCIEEQIKVLDGVILSGGDDMNPLFYNDSYHYKQGSSNYRRDEYDLKLINECRARGIPVLGICRGMQVMNVAYHGTLYQDNSEAGSVYMHSQKELKEYPVHMINIEEDSFLYGILGSRYPVNSFHHQSVKDLGEGLRIIARADDGIVEGIEHKEELCFGVQFHPEKMHSRDELMLGIIKKFIDIL